MDKSSCFRLGARLPRDARKAAHCTAGSEATWRGWGCTAKESSRQLCGFDLGLTFLMVKMRAHGAEGKAGQAMQGKRSMRKQESAAKAVQTRAR